MKNQNVRAREARLLLVLCLLAVLPSSVFAQPALTQPLVQAGNMRYLGSFTLPTSDGSGGNQGLLTFGGGVFSVNPSTQTLLLGGHDSYNRLCEVRIPAIGGHATMAQPCVDIMEGRIGQIDGGADAKLGGALVWNGRLIASAYSTYDADGNARASHVASGLDFQQQGDVQGPYAVGTAPLGFVSGYMGVVPPEWRDLFGGPALTGNCCVSIISRTSSGPAVASFNPDDVGRASPVPAAQLLAYPQEQPLAPPTTQNGLYLRGDEIRGVAFPAGTRSVLFIGKHSMGRHCYGEAADCGDPASAYKGDHGFPYALQVWAYDATQLAMVRYGLMQPWQVRPYAVWQLPELAANGYASISGAAYDHTSGRLYITTKYGEQPRVHVYQIGAENPSGLPDAPQSLVGTVQGSLVSLTWSPPPGGGHVGYVLEAGDAPGRAQFQLPLPATTMRFDSPVPAGRYYIRTRAFNSAPAAGPPSNEIMLNVGSVQAPAATPQNLRVSVAGTSVTFMWNAPDAGETVTTYLLDVGSQPGASNVLLGIPLGPGVGLSVPNVPPGTYYARLRAANQLGTSVASNEVTVVVQAPTLPGAPVNFQARASADRIVTFSWAAPRSGGAAVSYVLEAGSARGSSELAADVGGVTTVTLPNVPPGTYYLRARARNGAGLGPAAADVRLVVP